MNFEEKFKSWTLDQKVEWALGKNICNLSENMRSIIVDLKAENERLKGELEMEHDDCSNAKKCEIEYHKAYEKELDENVILRKENAKLKCLALHAMCEYFRYKFRFWLFTPNASGDKYRILMFKYREAYRKAKKALMGRGNEDCD